MMLRSFKISTLLVLALVCYTLAAEKDWSWNKKEGENSAASESATDSSQEREADVEPAGVNETHARHFVKDRLCDLGLGGCGEDEEIEGKRPHVQPHDLIYAQPVHLKPVGRPIPAIPVRGTGGITPPPISSNIYGPPRPVSLPYRPNNRPYKPYVSGPPPSVYEPDHDHSILQEKRPIGVVSGPSAAGSSSVQTHVHHHYHHGDDNKYPEIQTGISGSGGLYEPGNSLSSGIYSPGSSYNTYPFYKKQLSVKQPHALGGISGNLGPHQPYEKYPPFEPVRNGINDCYCVPYDQCPPNEIARKEDIRGPGLIDPRNNPNTDIQALGPDEVVVTDGNGTMTIVKQKRELNDDEASNLDTANKDRQRRDVGVDAAAEASDKSINARQAYYGGSGRCGPSQVCCRRPARTGSQYRPPGGQYTAQCGVRNAHGINGRIKTPVYVDGDSEFGEYPWQVAVLKKDPQESVYICGGTLIDASHVLTAAHCIKSYTAYDLRVRLGEWDVNHDVEFFPYEERDVSVVHVHPEFYAGTLYNDLAILRLDRPASVGASPHISPACLPEAHADFSGSRCWTTGWGKDAFGDYGKYQNILKEVDVPVLPHHQCQSQLQQTRLGYDFKLHPGFICAGGEEGKDACKGDGGGPMVCERNGVWQIVGVVSWGVGCGQYGVPGVYVRVQHYLPWIRQIVGQFK
ncbi:hypothetical protein O3M35_011622 [Rhynocoris fuscipes]|uniref:Phenoloxidase-activating factor 2 n=1 Tax=Rhynocoris fuscipes TaxID=488301 RepID=A0AAW1D334_9HEMI